MKVLQFPGVPYCFECGLYLSADRDPIATAKTGFMLFKHVGNNHCPNTNKVIKLPVALIDVEEL